MITVLPDEVAELIEDVSPAEDAASDAEVAAFLAEYRTSSRPELLLGPVRSLETAIAEGQSRHRGGTTALVWAMDEARAGYYPADDANGALREIFINAVTRQRKSTDRALTAQQAESEWAGSLAWAVGQAKAKTSEQLDAIKARIDAKVVASVEEVDAAAINGTENEVITSSGRYFDRAGLRARTLLSDCERLGPLASGIDGKVWAYIDGVWVHGDRILRSRVVDLLGERYRRAHADTIESMVQAREPFINDTPDTEHLNVENGLLQWRTGLLKPHTDKVPSTTRIPVRWNPDATCPNIDKFLQSVVDAECVPVLEEVAGYALYPDQPLHKAVMLAGSGRNGKGVYLRIMSALIGPANIAATPPQRLDTDRWAVAQLYGKLANLVGDVDPRTFKETATFKQATGQDMLQGEHKYAAPFMFTSRALIVAAFNSLPRSVDTTEGFFSRWLVVPFPNQFVDPDEHGNIPPGCYAKDPELAAKVTTTAELEGFLVRAVAGLQRVMERGRFTRAEAIADAETEFRRHADPVRGFLADKAVADIDAWISRADLHAAFKNWSADAGIGVMSARRFAEKVREVHFEVFGVACTEVKRGDRGWGGVRLRAFAEVEPDTDQGHNGHLGHIPLLSPPYAREKGRASVLSALSAPNEAPDPAISHRHEGLCDERGSGEQHLCSVCDQEMLYPASIDRGYCERCARTVRRDGDAA
jgi:putative DNA primase/helicase